MFNNAGTLNILFLFAKIIFFLISKVFNYLIFTCCKTY